jgi:VanZ family protein
MLSIRVYRVVAVIYAVVLVAVSSVPGLSLPRYGPGAIDKVLHFGQYAVLAFLSVRGFGSDSRHRIALLLFLIVFCAADEYHQVWIPGREAELSDWIADVLGILTGWSIGWMFLRRAVSRRRAPFAESGKSA